jgi:hypothetical protein
VLCSGYCFDTLLYKQRHSRRVESVYLVHVQHSYAGGEQCGCSCCCTLPHCRYAAAMLAGNADASGFFVLFGIRFELATTSLARGQTKQ